MGKDLYWRIVMLDWFTYLMVLIVGTVVVAWVRGIGRFWRNALNPLVICSCGHTARRETLVTEGGGMYFVDLDDENRSQCPDCARRDAIRCGLCGEMIFPGDAIITTELLTADAGVLVLRRIPFLEGVACMAHPHHVVMTGSGVLTARGEVRLARRHVNRCE